MDLKRKKLKLFLEENIPFYPLKEVGFFGKDVRKTDYEKIAERVCWMFGYKSIYEYKKVCNGKLCDGINCTRDNPNCISHPFGKFHPIKWKPLEVVQERELWFNETYLN